MFLPKKKGDVYFPARKAADERWGVVPRALYARPLGLSFVVRDRCGACLHRKLIPFPRQAAPWHARGDSAVDNSRSFLCRKEFMATARRTRLNLHCRRRAARSTATPSHFFIPGGAHHPVPSRRVSVRNYTNRLRRCGYVAQVYHPAPLGAADPIDGCILCHRNVRYFLPPTTTRIISWRPYSTRTG